MPLKDYTTGTNNKILIGGAGAVGLIITAIVGVSVYTPAYQVRDSSGQVTWQVNLKGDSTQSGVLATKSLLGCDTIDTTSTGMLICGTDASGGGVNTGAILDAGDDRWVNVGGDTMTGALNIRAALSGSSLFTLSNYKTCTLKTTATGMTVCGSDDNTTYIAGQGLSLIGTSFRMNAAVTGSSLTAYGTISGSLITQNGAGNNYFLGNLGLGTTTPSTALHIVSPSPILRFSGTAANQNLGVNFYDNDTTLKGRFIYAGGNSAGNRYVGFTNDGGDYLGFFSNVFRFQDSTAERMRLSGAYLGIGTTAPSEALDLSAGTLLTTQAGITEVRLKNTGLEMKNILSSGGWARGLLTYLNSAGSSYFQIGARGTSQTLNRLFIGPAFNNTWMTFGTNGNVGVNIGDNTAGAKLTVAGNVLIGSSVTTAAPKAQIEVIGTISGSLITQNGAGNNFFQGNLGIGKTPTTKLEVAGTISGATIIQNGAGSNYFRGRVSFGRADSAPAVAVHIQSANGAGDGIRLTKQTVDATHILYQFTHSSNDKDIFWFGYDGTTFWNFQRFLWDDKVIALAETTGSVAIGKTNAKAKLDVAGTMSGSAVTVSGKPANTVVCYKAAGVLGYWNVSATGTLIGTCN